MKVRRLEYCRSRAYLTQEALAARSGISRDTISKLESGERVNAHAKTVAKLAEALRVHTVELEGASSYDELYEGETIMDGRASGGGGWRDRLRRKLAGLGITESQKAEFLSRLRRTLDEGLPEETPAESYVELEQAALLIQGWGYEESRSMAEDRVYGPEEIFEVGKN